MLFRFTNKIEDLGTSAGLIIGKYVKALSIVILVYLVSNKEEKFKGKNIFIFVNVILFLLIYFPTSAARFQIIAAYLGLFLIITLKPQSKYKITLLFLLGLFIVFPSLEVFRNLKSFNQFNLNNVGNSINSAFNEGHYDSYQMFVNSINYLAENGVTWGRQISGTLLFFVPRSLWPDKPVGSGAYVSGNMGMSLDNVSMPIVGEAYINFGILGIILFAYLFGLLCRRFDQRYWKKVENNDNGLLVHFYPVLIGYFFFMNRGDLMSSFAFIMGLYFAFLTIHWIKNIFSIKSTK
jgi:oligosaccharide repeat unit polymerase